MENEFKFSALRQFGSENISFTATIHSKNSTLTEDEIKNQIDQINFVISEEFKSVQEREISEKALLVAASDRRRVEVERLDKALKDEIEAKKSAQNTMNEAEKLSNEVSGEDTVTTNEESK